MISEQILATDQTTTIIRTQDVTPHLRAAAAARDDLRPGSDLRHVGTIPHVIVEQWMHECGAGIGTIEFAEYVKRKLMDGEFSKFATGRF